MKIPDKVKAKLRALPARPGCYIMRDRRGTIVYVGKAVSLRDRVRSYFRAATLRSGSPKLRGLIRSVADIEVIVTRSEPEAILTESRLIKDYRPRYNVSLKDDKRFLLLRVSMNAPFPRFSTSRIQRDRHARYFGPYASSPAARAALDFIEKRFGLRKCAVRNPNAETYKHCMDDIVRHCSAPCVDKISRADYRARAETACAFLKGEHPKVIDELVAEMAAAAKRLDYERASALRDTLFLLRAAVKQRTRISRTPELRREEARAGVDELGRVLELARPPRVIEAFDVSNISGTYAVASLVCAVDGAPKRNRYRHFRIRTVEGVDDPRMMAEAVRRRYARLVAEKQGLPDLVLVDGGKTQLNAAAKELAGLGLSTLAVAGLAKRYEEIHVRGRRSPIRLARDAPALKVLQALRDEAHRFALMYHRKLRSRRIRESVLDDIPGIGRVRKERLLAHFGSFARLKKATEVEIAETPGFGRKSAAMIFGAIR